MDKNKLIMRKIHVLSKKNFDSTMILNNLKDSNVEEKTDVCYISIIGTGGECNHYFRENHSNVLNVEFDDISFFDNELGCTSIDDEIAETIYNFIKSNIHRKTYVIHCMAGISRSGAVGQFIDDIYGSLDFKVLSPQVCPNKLVYAMIYAQHHKTSIT